MTPPRPPSISLAPPPSVRVRAPGKVNLSLRVGAVQDDGYHPLVTIFQAVGLSEDVVAHQVPPGSGVSLSVSGLQADAVPTDETNLAWRAAAALVACDALWDAGVPRAELVALAAGLGADVAFGLVGHTAVGTGRGDVLTPAMTRGEFHWVFAVQAEGLSTAQVYRTFDETVGGPAELDLAEDTALMQARRAGDAVGLGQVLRNDLQGPALTLRPELQRTIDVATEAGALGAIVSGSGPTVAALARSRQHALAIAASWTANDACDTVWCTTAPAAGARVVAH